MKSKFPINPPDVVKSESIAELQEKIKSLQSEVLKLRVEKQKLEILLSDNGIGVDPEAISDIEAVCVQQLKMLREKSALQPFTETDSKILDIIHKNLKLARGEKIPENRSKAKKMSTEDLKKVWAEEFSNVISLRGE